MNPYTILRWLTVISYSLSYSCTRRQLSIMSTPTFNQRQKCMAPVWQNNLAEQGSHTLGGHLRFCGPESCLRCRHPYRSEGLAKYRCESELYGSCFLTVSRTCGGLRKRNISDVYLARTWLGVGPCPFWSPPFMPFSLRKSCAVDYLDDGLYHRLQVWRYARCLLIDLLLLSSQNCLCIEFHSPYPTGNASGVHWRAQEGRQLVGYLPPASSPLCYVSPIGLEQAGQIDGPLNQVQPDCRAALVWRYTSSPVLPLWAFDAGCAVGGRNYIRHIVASKKLVDRFEEVDDSMYNEIVRWLPF